MELDKIEKALEARFLKYYKININKQPHLIKAFAVAWKCVFDDVTVLPYQKRVDLYHSWKCEYGAGL